MTTTSNNSNTLDISLFKLRLEAIQPYEGTPETLNNFIYQVNRLLSYYPNPSDVTSQTIFDQIRAKLRGRAALQFGSKHFADWNGFSNALKSAFSLGKDLNNYRDDIINCRKTHSESTLDFAHKVRNHFDLLIDFINAQNYTDQERLTIAGECESLVIHNIIHNCPHDLQRHFFTTKPTTIHEIVTEIQRDNSFRELHQSKFSNSVQKPPNFRNSPPIPIKMQYQQNTPNFQPRVMNHQQFHPWNRPTQPPNLPPRRIQNMPPRPFNNHNSGQYHNNNVFRPGQQSNLPKTTPMDISTQQTIPFKNRNFQQNYAQNNYNPNKRQHVETHNIHDTNYSNYDNYNLEDYYYDEDASRSEQIQEDHEYSQEYSYYPGQPNFENTLHENFRLDALVIPKKTPTVPSNNLS